MGEEEETKTRAWWKSNGPGGEEGWGRGECDIMGHRAGLERSAVTGDAPQAARPCQRPGHQPVTSSTNWPSSLVEG